MLAAGREPSHDFAARQDCASTEKSDSRNDLSRDTRRIKDDVCLRDRGRKAKSGYDHEKASTYAHQHVCPDAKDQKGKKRPADAIGATIFGDDYLNSRPAPPML